MPKSASWWAPLVTTVTLGLLLGGCGNGYYQGPVTDHFDGTRFHNLGGDPPRGLTDFLEWRLTRDPPPWPEHVEVTTTVPPARVEGAALRVTWVNHATMLIQTQGLNILTDPTWDRRASPFSWIGPKRVHAPAVRFDDLPPIDLVIVSHNHYDHLNVATLKRLWDAHRPRIVMPLGNGPIVHADHPEIAVETYDWGAETDVAPGVGLCLHAMQHWSARGLLDRNHALWAAFVITTPAGAIFFAGDTGYDGGDEFRLAARQHGPFRLAILPIGAYDPRWFMETKHMTPEEAISARADLGARHTLGHHFDTFPLADTPYGEPRRRLAAARAEAGLGEDAFRTLVPGGVWEVPR